ncbi:unnamed protein product [Zymoseptoria tritici ST99CH_1A5]|uniref:CENP-V/GFA domain-containing protein n=1 Tax=Zymoseptoria tritici ST99CH_1A5 TaxID=1276529 RepID=A0A1Y6LLB7_ZYMTR|nr:unnamed protein product [Zymoseptoria tritici ST99CH_1A5]
MTGQLCLTLARLPWTYAPESTLLSRLQKYDFSENISHYFCPSCGTNILCRTTDRENGTNPWMIAVGTLEEGDTSVFEVARHIFVGDTGDGGFADFLTSVNGKHIPRYANHPGSEQLPLYRTHPNRRTQASTSPDDKLHGYCHCRGVQFCISRPSTRSAWAKIAHETGSYPTDQPLPLQRETFWLRADRTKFRAAVCPCDSSCRLAANGNAFAQWAYIPTVDMSLDAEGKIPMPKSLRWGTLKTCRTSERASQHFCGRCGAVVFWNTVARPHLKDFGVGLFEGVDGARCEGWFEWRTKEMRHRADGLRRAKELTLAVEEGLREYGKRLRTAAKL